MHHCKTYVKDSNTQCSLLRRQMSSAQQIMMLFTVHGQRYADVGSVSARKEVHHPEVGQQVKIQFPVWSMLDRYATP
jgi:hypothetical protein